MTAVPDICFSAYQLTYNSLYRYSLYVHLMISLASMIPLVYFIALKLCKTSFHGNLKFLFASYFLSVFLLSLDFGVVSILLDILIIYYIYCDEHFTDKSISFIFFPTEVAPKMFIYFCVMGILNLINFLFNTVANVISVISCHFLLFSLYIAGIGILRYFGSKIIPDSIDLMAFRGAFTTMISFNNLVVGVVAVYLNRKMKQRKRNLIEGTVKIKTTGNVGAQNYDNQIFRIWNSTLKMH